MEIRAIRTFATIVKYGNFLKAAEALNYSQPTITLHIKHLEEEIGERLLERGKSLKMTEAGRLFYERANTLLREYDRLDKTLQDLEVGMAGLIRLGVSEPTASFEFPAIIADFKNKYPKIELSIQIADANTLSTMLHHDEIDIAVCGAPEVSMDNIFKPLFYDEGGKEDLKATPITRTNPEIFLLGGSVESAELAAKLGISFVFAYFINGDEKILQEARNQFKKHSPKDANNSFLLAITVVVADDDLKAISYINQKETIKIIFSDGRKLNVASLDHAEKLISESNETEYQLKIQKAGYIAGSKETVKNNIENLLNKNDINEIVVLSPIVDIQERIHSYRLLKEIFEVSTNGKEKISEGLGAK